MKMCADVHISPPNSNWLILQVLDTESLFLCTVFHSELMPYLPTFESSHSCFLPNRDPAPPPGIPLSPLKCYFLTSSETFRKVSAKRHNDNLGSSE